MKDLTCQEQLKGVSRQKPVRTVSRKTCLSCGRVRRAESFYKTRHPPDGLLPYCIPCVLSSTKAGGRRGPRRTPLHDGSPIPKVLRSVLWSKREVDEVAGCWVWTGTWTADGRGVLSFCNRKWPVGVAAAYVWLGRPLGSPGFVGRVRSCPNPACFHPDHLVVAATRRELHRTGRMKLTPTQVVDARRRVAAGETKAEVARSLGVVPGTVQFLTDPEGSWSHVKEVAVG